MNIENRMYLGIMILAGILFSPMLVVFGPLYLLGWAVETIGRRLGFDVEMF